jgi:uncharacterized protein YndB with AHSA1/START domain
MAEPLDEYTARASIEIEASPETVYDLVSDVTRVGQWSPEATGTVGHPHHLKVGDRFWGLNRKGLWRWFTHCTIRVADRGQRFVFDVDLGPSEVSRWTYEFEPTTDGCRVTETWEDRRFGARSKPIEWIGQIIIPGPRAAHNQWNIETSLQRLKAVAEGQE